MNLFLNQIFYSLLFPSSKCSKNCIFDPRVANHETLGMSFYVSDFNNDI